MLILLLYFRQWEFRDHPEMKRRALSSSSIYQGNRHVIFSCDHQGDHPRWSMWLCPQVHTVFIPEKPSTQNQPGWLIPSAGRRGVSFREEPEVVWQDKSNWKAQIGTFLCNKDGAQCKALTYSRWGRRRHWPWGKSDFGIQEKKSHFLPVDLPKIKTGSDHRTYFNSVHIYQRKASLSSWREKHGNDCETKSGHEGKTRSVHPWLLPHWEGHSTQDGVGRKAFYQHIVISSKLKRCYYGISMCIQDIKDRCQRPLNSWTERCTEVLK